MMFDPQRLPLEQQEREQESMTAPKAPILKVKVTDHRYHPLQQVLDECALDIGKGEIVSLIGPSGCGKSTFLKIAAGLLEPSDGKVCSKAGESAVLFQEHRLLPWKSLRDNMSFGFKGRALSEDEKNRRLEKAAKIMGFVSTDMEKYPSELSGGMRQRAALARALVIEPDMLFLDEPFSALDIGRRREMYRLLLGEVRQRHCTVLMVTHDVFEALCLSDRVIVMAPDPGCFLKQINVDIPLDQRTRHLVADLEAELLADQQVADLFKMQNWDQVL
ncbi:MAG: ATP-binding cassette domain-containing protein [Cohaesibacter sp.]|nr:ATP-binding cassette domain-containing protein [Cohaesibacter sp.]